MGDCVQCGFCCHHSPCPYGEWDYEKHKCIYVKPLNDGRYYCEKYDYIKKHKNSGFSPAFGTSCSSTLFNKQRNKIIRQIKNKNIITNG